MIGATAGAIGNSVASTHPHPEGILVEMDVFSGRPNPGWKLGPLDATTLQEKVDGLPPHVGPDPLEPLGYRGLRVSGAESGAVIMVSAGTVLVQDRTGSVHRLSDDGRSLECWLLQKAAGHVDEDLRQMALAGIGSGCV